MQKLLGYMPKEVRRQLVRKALRTVIFFRNGSKIIALPNNPDTIRGHKAHLCILDEAAFFYNDIEARNTVIPPMLATTGGTLILSSTPWGKNSEFYRLSVNPSYTHFHENWRTPLREGIYDPSFKTQIESTRLTNPSPTRPSTWPSSPRKPTHG